GIDDVLEGHSVEAWGARVGADQVPSSRQCVDPIDPVLQGIEPELRLLLGLLAQLLPQKREFLRQVPVFRSGIVTIQAVLPSSCSRTYLAGLLGSAGITPLRRYYEPRRLPTRARRAVMLSPTLLDWCPPGRVSQVPNRSLRTRRPLSP